MSDATDRVSDAAVATAKEAAHDAAKPMRSLMDPVSDAAASCILANDDMWRAALSAAATFQRRDAGWQPIETAPKDGTFVDMWRVTERAGYREPNMAYRLRAWRREGTGSLGYSESFFTHWRPSPTPPEAIRASADLSQEGSGR